jgi:HK97 family phage portal protein
MADNVVQRLINKVKVKLTGNGMTNDFNQAFFQWLGGLPTQYDQNGKTYIEKGYNENPDVFSIINKQTVKTVSVPYYIKQIDDRQAFAKLRRMELATKGNMSLLQTIKHKKLSTKADKEEEMPFPLADPNPTQTWADIFGLYKTYMKTTGNFYLYTMTPKDGANAGVPMQSFVLPSHLMQIVLKKDAKMLTTENPIDHYMLIEGLQYIKFDVEDVIHVKYSNPNFDMQGSQLYGQSPLRAALRNINSQNSAIDNNIKMLQSSGAFGLIYGKGSTPWTMEQAQSIKDRLKEMDASPERLAKIAGVSAEVGFQRISLTTEELRPFEYLNWDRATIANCLNYPDELLNNDTKTSLQGNDNSDARKQLITDDIKPDLVLLQNALNKSYIPRFKGYENAVIEWDVTELPEMQTDMKTQAEALNLLPVTPNEKRTVFGYETLPDDGMDVVWMPTNVQRIDDVSPGVIDNANSI